MYKIDSHICFLHDWMNVFSGNLIVVIILKRWNLLACSYLQRRWPFSMATHPLQLITDVGQNHTVYFLVFVYDWMAHFQSVNTNSFSGTISRKARKKRPAFTLEAIPLIPDNACETHFCHSHRTVKKWWPCRQTIDPNSSVM